MRESFEDWQALGRDLISRGLGAPMLIVADGAPGLTKAIEQCWPASDRQRCCCSPRPQPLRQAPRPRTRARQARLLAGPWTTRSANRTPNNASKRSSTELDAEGFTAAARCLADDLDALVVHLRYPLRTAAMAINEPARTLARRSQTTHEGDGPLPRRERAASPSSGPSSTSSSPTKPTASTSTRSTASTSNEHATKATSNQSPRRSQPHRLNATGEIRIYSSKETLSPSRVETAPRIENRR